ncbi:MAG: MFS transporter [Acidimicrobiales bacterium]|nr:MFS transporter [Acidimicrobiales bacterium]MDP7219717.1 MFS transporter [Arenicellales bacterium]
MTVAVSVSAAGVLPVFLTAALAVQIRDDLDLSVAALGALVGVFFGVSALGSAPLGRVVERRGWASGIQLAAIGSGLTQIGMATVARNAWTIGALFIVGGLAAAMSRPAADFALTRSVPPCRHGLLFGLKHAAAPAAVMLGGLAVPGFALTIGWRWAYIAGAAISFSIFLGTPRQLNRAEDRRRLPGGTTPSTPIRVLFILAVATALGIASADALASFFVTYAVEVGVGEGSAGTLLAGCSAIALISRLIAGWLVDKRQHASLLGIGGLLIIGALGLTVLATGGRQWLIVGAMLGFAAGWGWSGLMTFFVVWANPHAPAVATGITHTGTYVGAAVGPLLIGHLAERTSFTVAWWSTSAMLGTAAILVLGVWVFGRSGGNIAVRNNHISAGDQPKVSGR